MTKVPDTGGVIIATSIIVCGNLADGGTVESTLLFHRCPSAEQVGQLGDVGGDAPRLVAGEQGWVSEMRDRRAEVQCP